MYASNLERINVENVVRLRKQDNDLFYEVMVLKTKRLLSEAGEDEPNPFLEQVRKNKKDRIDAIVNAQLRLGNWGTSDRYTFLHEIRGYETSEEFEFYEVFQENVIDFLVDKEHLYLGTLHETPEIKVELIRDNRVIGVNQEAFSVYFTPNSYGKNRNYHYLSIRGIGANTRLYHRLDGVIKLYRGKYRSEARNMLLHRVIAGLAYPDIMRNSKLQTHHHGYRYDNRSKKLLPLEEYLHNLYHEIFPRVDEIPDFLLSRLASVNLSLVITYHS